MNKLLILPINSTDNLQFLIEVEDIVDMNLYNMYFTIWLKRQDNMLKLNGFTVGHDLYDFSEQIQSVIKNQRTIPLKGEGNIDIGLLWNEHNQKIILAEEAGSPLKSWKWFGDTLLFFGNTGDTFNSSMTFLYNDKQGNIILEVCSVYPWFFEENPPIDLYISYDDWLPQYKILYKTIISKNIAQQWVKELHALYEKLDKNMPF